MSSQYEFDEPPFGFDETENTTPDKDSHHIGEFRDRILGELRLRAQYGDDASGGETVGITEFDEYAVPEAGKLIVIAARPGVGKTALGLQMARHIATKVSAVTGHGGIVPYYITEMGAQETVERIIANFAQIEANSLKRRVTEGTVRAVEKAFDGLESSGLYVINAAGWAIDRLMAHARRFHREHGELRAIFVDNLTGLSPSEVRRSQGSSEYIGEIVKKLNILAMTGVGVAAPVFLLAHLNRPDRRAIEDEPVGDQLAGSDHINRWASVIALMWKRPKNSGNDATGGSFGEFGGFGGPFRDPTGLMAAALQAADPESGPGDFLTGSDGETWAKAEVGAAAGECTHELIVMKNRNGKEFRCDLRFIGPQMRFVDPLARSVRPYQLADPETPARAAFRAAMRGLVEV